MNNPSFGTAAAQTRLVRNLVRFTGRDPLAYSALVADDGCIGIRCPVAAVFYPVDAWTSKFIRHLHAGFFDVAQPAAAVA